jgi:hypothetical protein
MSLHYPFIVQYPENCGHECHDLIELQLKEKTKSLETENKLLQQHQHSHQQLPSSLHHYSIIDAEHALIYTDQTTMKALYSSSKDHLLDFIPFLPELKIEQDVNIETICLDQSEMAVNVVFLPSTEREVAVLKSTLSSFTSSSSLPFHLQYSNRDLEAFLPHQENILTLTFSCDDETPHTILSYLSERSDVQWIELYHPSSLRLRYANGISQSGKSKTPLFHANLTGIGHVIGIADSGIDSQSCYFRDAILPFPYQTYTTHHRKLVIYINDTGNSLDDSGHGTGVAGSASGKCIDPKNKLFDYNGSAYDAKIAFMDIGDTADDRVQPPSNLYTGIFSRLYDVGSKIQTMSWGSASSSYTTQARYVDQFMWDHKDSLIFIAAGNDGKQGAGTVGTPATNKNGVAAGASYNDEEAWNANGKVSTKGSQLTKDSLASFSSRGPTADNRLKPDICAVGALTVSPPVSPLLSLPLPLSLPLSLSPSVSPSLCLSVSLADSDCPTSGTNLGSAAYEESCSITIVEGTSFSSPLMAGYAVLVRQYFLDGFYPSGFRNPSNSFPPSGALVKAILVNSAAALEDINDEVRMTSTKQGDNNQGYGRIQLNNALSFNIPSTLNGLTMFVKGSSDPTNAQYVELSATNEQHVYQFTSKTDALADVRVTLAYTDYYGAMTISVSPLASSPLSVSLSLSIGTVGSTRALVNDLDVFVTGNQTYYPLTAKSDTTPPSDRINNLEFITFTPCPGCSYTVTVRAKSLSRAQPYSLVITGDVGKFTYSDSYKGVTTGLTQKAKIAVIVAAILAFCLTICVFWLAFGRPVRRRRINEVKEIYRRSGSNV